MAMIDVSRQRRSLLSDATALHHLPADLLDLIKDPGSPNILDAVSEAALIPPLTDHIFAHFEAAFPDICARWILRTENGSRQARIASAFARILPFASFLSTFLTRPVTAEHDTTQTRHQPPSLRLALWKLDETSAPADGSELLQQLITVWRLVNFDVRDFKSLVSTSFLQVLFGHDDRAVRYVAIRVFCKLLRASDNKLEALLEKHVGNDEAIMGDLDGTVVDFGFLTLHEQARAKRVVTKRQQLIKDVSEAPEAQCTSSLTPYVVAYGTTLLPRPHGPIGDPSSLVPTPTTLENIQGLATLLQREDPILLHGPPGVGKSSLIQEVAKQLGMQAGMVTLHLNEQTDAKMLVGLYTTGSKPGSFQWRPGVLTTAVKEGRWVLVEDLDRAPTEVLSTLLPLIERRELLIPSRGERIRAANSFRLLGTVRTSKGMNGRENLPSLVGMRFWQMLHTQPLAQSELEDVILQTYPILTKFLPGILAVYDRISRFSNSPHTRFRGSGATGRPINLRDLLKWCRRLRDCLLTAGSKTGEEPISETTRDWMFMEAIDCFVGNCANPELSTQLLYAIAEEMHLSRERADHYVTARIPPLEEHDHSITVGRVRLRKNKGSKIQKSKRPFASTTHAKKLLEQISVAVKLNEPVLLVGETGIGKTTVVQQLADSLGHKLFAVNLSQQSEVGDLLGGFKPVNVRSLAVPLKEEFEDLFAATGISASKNQKYLESVGKSFAKSQWSRVSKLWKEAPKMFLKIVDQLQRSQDQAVEARNGDDGQPPKRRKTTSKLQSLLELRPRWDAFARNLEQFDVQISGGSGTFAFSFVEGNLVKAVRNGDWVLLDEINLASPDTLESIADLLTGPAERPSVLLSETGEIEKIVAHPNFRIFGAMNPATDIGKRDLPQGIRSRFTELYVRSPDADIKDLLTIIKTYLGSTSTKHDQAADDVARLYLNTKRMAEDKSLVDGANEVPHFSLRTLTRVLTYVNSIAPLYGLRRALYEGFSMGFLTLLDRNSENLLVPLIHHHLLDKAGNPQSLLSQAPKHPNDGKQYVKFKNQNHDRQYWLFQGNEQPIQRDDYIITPFVERNLLNLVRATSTRRFPILIQGPTSAGKTSMIEYLANYTGNRFVRINNHEHTDLQEYLGTYVSGPDGKLRFQEGLLVQAMRQGHWIVLDELNLAPTDVLEALNRLLDDNRELLIPETQEVVRPHENFILFATQNPPGVYGGRKALSRAFRNRFLELHFDDIPEDELEYILQHRSQNTSPPDCRRIVSVYKELSRLRQTSRLFEQKDSFATLRDLFRWALREAETREEIAAHGFMLLAERVRNEEERVAVREVIEKVFKVKIDPQKLYSTEHAPELKRLGQQTNSQGVVWTHAMRRLYVLVSRAVRNNEPVLLVGETGCGKTTVCQVLAEVLQKEIHIVNAHQNTETGDLIGSQRPIRNRGAILEALNADLQKVFSELGKDPASTVEEALERYSELDQTKLDAIPFEMRERINANEIRSKALFEWSDGALVEAMRDGQYFLLDEISLADDSVLERLNSVLEPQRTLLLAEKGIDNSFVVASAGFQFFATMNPGGDFGKKELSPALRNRFTEIWVPPLSAGEDVRDIAQAKLAPSLEPFVDVMVRYSSWFGETYRSMASTRFSIREILVWVQFLNRNPAGDHVASLVHGASTIFIDSIGANPSAILATDPESILHQRQSCLEKLGELLGKDIKSIYETQPELSMTDTSFAIGGFAISRIASDAVEAGFSFQAPTTRLNAMRVLRALQMHKPILLEGSPGVGKTTLVAAIAKTCGRPLTRINLSDQTDLMDLFGTDVPVEGAEAGNFAWRDAPFLQAMQRGEWVLLDEMNLASQSVLEGLNACLDHRGEVYVAELDQVFKRHPDFRLFAAQNPHHQGGGRKGLPSSFVNRFIVVYADVFTSEDLNLIAKHNYPTVPDDVTSKLIQFISLLEQQLTLQKSFGSQGGPWEFNLRDVLRWLQLLSSTDPLFQQSQMDDFLDIIVRQRFRSEADRLEVTKLFRSVTGADPRQRSLYHDLNATAGQVGLAILPRNQVSQPQSFPVLDIVPRLPELESLMICVKQSIPCILSGPSGHGKTALLEHTAALAGKPLVVFPMNADIDAMDLVGGFEQADPLRELNSVLRDLRSHLLESIMSCVPDTAPSAALDLSLLLEDHNMDEESLQRILAAVSELLSRVDVSSTLGGSLASAAQALQNPLTLANPRFEWLDGVIIKALQEGQWLVLDNANLCSASVLDRLNSLLEPNGFLSVNEHCGPGGEPRIVEPHPDFRIFLTVDPRFGELSRAMRNRAVEIHFHLPPPTIEHSLDRVASVESSLARYLLLQQMADSPVEPGVWDIGLDNLTFADISLITRYTGDTSLSSQDPTELRQSTQDFVRFLQSAQGLSSLGKVTSLDHEMCAQFSMTSPKHQPHHPLHNLPMATLLSNTDNARWTAACIDVYRSIHIMHGVIELCRRQSQQKKVTSLSRLQRSIISSQVAAVSKDSTVHLASFLVSVFGSLQNFMSLDFSASTWKSRASSLQQFIKWMQCTMALSNAETFDEARFQAHLAQGSKLLAKQISTATDEISQFWSSISDLVNGAFTTGFRLSTGLSMELLWRLFRPQPIASSVTLDRSIQLDKLGSRFDALRWKIQPSIPDLAKSLATLTKAYGIVRNDSASSDELVEELKRAFEPLEAHVGEEDVAEIKPYLSTEFESLRQISALQSLTSTRSASSSDGELQIFSNVPTKSSMVLSATQDSAALLQSVDYLTCQSQYAWDGRFTTALCKKLENLSSVNLRALALLEAELPAMGARVAAMTNNITSSPLSNLNGVLWQLLLETLGAHDPSFVDAAQCVFAQLLLLPESGLKTSIDNPSIASFFNILQAQHLRSVASDHFMPMMIALAMAKQKYGNQTGLCSEAWLHFSMGALKLYVPDRAFDPQLQPMVEREFHEDYRSTLDEKILSLQAFENSFTGQHTNERINLLEQEIAELGPLPPEVQPVFRPQVTELVRLQAEFANILNTISSPALVSVMIDPAQEPAAAAEALALAKENTQRLLDRITGRFEAYQDMTRPAANLLRCLLIGISLFEASSAQTISRATWQLAEATPFVGSSALQNFDEVASQTNFEYLGLAAATVAVDGVNNLQPHARESIFNCFHKFNDDWTQKLEKEREAEAVRSSLYKFRGSLEDEEEMDAEEFAELFPTYDDDEGHPQQTANPSDMARNASLKVALAHKKIFLEPLTPETAIRNACVSVGSRITTEMKDLKNIDLDLNQELMPSTLLMLDEKVQSLRSNEVEKSYNFYNDSNLPEVRKLVALADNVRGRFRQLQMVDEIGHMQPLADVVQSCDKLLDIVHAEPLARILPKLEQLHGYVYEWQFGGWASRDHTVLPQHNGLTDTIIRWRRLELSTWANLFDMEQKKCEEDAHSWWFIAYQVVIAAPLSLLDRPQELRSYAVELVRDLELYFSTSIIGQFGTRLSLLRQFRNHLALLCKDYPALSQIENTLASFIAFYERFERLVGETIQKGRVPIEKKMKDVLLLASWKDTNISALRESARKSHQKLFRLVRKFRGVLGQEMKVIIEQGLPDEEHEQPTTNVDGTDESQVVQHTSLDSLQTVLPGWLSKHKRMANVTMTLSVMRQITKSPDFEFSVSKTIDEYVESLTTSMADLRKETPTHLTDENKELVKHLKTRKRKLYADTLKDLRAMGLKHNLGQDKLNEQDSLSIIFASIQPLNPSRSDSLRQADYYFHKTIDLAPKARAASWEHSEDLTGAEVSRSIGYVEGLINLLLAQRREMADDITSLSRLRDASTTFANLGAVEKYHSISRRKEERNPTRAMMWLVQLISFSVRLVQSHENLGGVRHTATKEMLEAWRGRIETHLVALGDEDALPVGMAAQSQLRAEKDLVEALDNFRSDLDDLVSHSPNLSFVADHLRPWTCLGAFEIPPPPATVQLAELANALSTTCDVTLVAIEGAKKTGHAISRVESAAGWLMKQDGGLASVVQQLRIATITEKLTECLNLLHHMELHSENAAAVMSLFAITSRILDQFHALCNELIEKRLDMHRSLSKMTFILTRTLTQLASQGFCTPQEKSDETSGDSGQLDTGTGLGDGEGAEDISKDVQPDEDLSELAQEANKEGKDEVEDEKDAVDMADEELEGEMGSVNGADEDDDDGSKKDEEEDEQNDMDEEAGDVDDLDPTAVDEKMWDGENEDEAEKDQQGDKSSGQKKEDEQMAAEENSKSKEEEKDQEVEGEEGEAEAADEEEAAAEEEDVQAQEELNRQEQTAQENDALELPEEMDLNFDEDNEELSSGEEDLDAMSDIEDDKEVTEEQAEEGMDEKQPDDEEANGHEDASKEVSEEPEEGEGVAGEDEVQEDVKEEPEEPEEPQPEPEAQEQSEQNQDRQDNATTDQENAAPSDVKSSGQDDQNADSMDVDDDFKSKAAQQQQGEMGQGAADQAASSGEQGSTSRSQETNEQPEQAQEDESWKTAREDPFKKLGSALERWHRQQTDIKEANPEDDDGQGQKPDMSQGEMGQREFQHLQNEETAEDTQALGTADKEEAQPIDESMAIDEEKVDPSSHVIEEDKEDSAEQKPDEVEANDAVDAEDQIKNEREDGRSGVSTRQGNYNREPSPMEETAEKMEEDEDEDQIEETSTQLSITHIADEERQLRDYGESLEQWSEFQSKTHGLSLFLTSQLRLILTPSQSTKLSGSFRTGKRLNIKRIIPYIASSYKRDKIWMRRSIPTKRTYQIMLCVDDSKSMGESASGNLAMESLVMVSRSLAMLEAGQIGVMGFGKDVFTAHQLTDPFASDAGAKILQNFSFSQDRTDIALLIRRTIDRFREARQQSSGNSDLWQLALILSDGLTPSAAHDSIRRLLREAMEERIMIVFIIMDDTAQKKGDSVLELKEAKFVKDDEGESRVVIERYLDTFPFQYYLIVHHLEELPSALAGLLRTWFAEVNA